MLLTGIPVFYLAFLLAPIATNVSATGTEEGHGGELAATCLTRGVWQRGDPSRAPPYAPRVASNGQDVNARVRRARARWWRQTACSNATLSAPWQHYEWRPENRSAACAAVVREVDRMAEPSLSGGDGGGGGGMAVCEALGRRSVLFVGDSISLQMYEVGR